MKLYKAIAIIPMFVVLSCATQEEAQYNWVKSKSSAQENEYIISDSVCTAESYKAIPELPASNCDNLEGFSRGFCNGSAAAKAEETWLLRNKIYDGCMLGKGWEKQPK